MLNNREYPFVYGLDKDPVEHIKTGDHVKIDGNEGIVEVTRGENLKKAVVR